MSDPVEVVRELYAAVAAGDRDGVTALLAPQVRWQGRERGLPPLRWRPRSYGPHDVTASMLLIGPDLPSGQPRLFRPAGDRVLVDLSTRATENHLTWWWSVLTVRDDKVVVIEDFAHHPDALRALQPEGATGP